jgi:predicted DNA-binding protein (MmcQ/YjbR family)
MAKKAAAKKAAAKKAQATSARLAAGLRKAERELRAAALAYPQAVEEFPWEHRAFKVKGKMFLIVHGEPGVLNLTVKLPQSHRQAVALPFATPAGYGLGKSGWVTAHFEADDEVPVEMLLEWLDESFRAVAPKRIAALLDG